MVLTKTKKEQSLQELKELFGNSSASVASNYSGISGSELTALRKAMKLKNIKLIVTKNTLVKKALSETGLTLDESILDQPVIFAFGNDEAEVCKEIFTFAKEHENLEILGGIIGKEQSNAAKVKVLALLPGREELQASLVGILASPTRGLVNVLSGNIRGLVTVLKQYQEKII